MSFRFLTVFLFGILSSSLAGAQGTVNPATAGNLATETVEKTSGQPISATKVISNPIEMFRGWSQLYKGYDRTPVLFDDLRYGRERTHPRGSYPQSPAANYFTGAEQQHLQRNSIKVFNLGVDDEVNKATMTIYQPLHFMHQDFANDPMQRDRHLDMFKTLRGTAVLTLSYLDKTVAAGLATTQAQADAHLSNQLLKQLNWTSSKLANPHRAMLYQDIDEKVEACLKWGSTAVIPRTGRVPFSTENVCDVECRDPKYGVPGLNDRVGGRVGKVGNINDQYTGAYDYCVCCAEIVTALNATVRTGTFNPADKNPTDISRVTSLVDRIFLGTEGPTGNIPGPQLALFRDNIANFREMYGDVLISPCQSYAYQGQGGDAQTDSPTCLQDGSAKIEYRLPELSVADKIKLFRDGLPNPQECATRSGTGCPMVGSPIKDGICPAIHKIMTRWPPEENDQELRELWLQASMGRLLTGDDINNMFIMAQLEPGELRGVGFNQDLRRMDDSGWNRVSSRFKRYLNTFCDSMAVSAFKKYHFRMMALSEDQLRINQKATEHDKSKFRDLMARVSAQIELAERDMESSSVADRMLAGLDTEADRERVASMGASAEAQQAAMWNERMKNNITLWNWFRGSGNR
jgi:hypothetical protein